MPVYAITGANRGLGLEFVRQLLGDSSNTVIGAVRSMQNDLTDLKALDKEGHLRILECDTSNPSSISRFGDEVTKLLGKDGQLHYLINNAGINTVPDQTSLDLDENTLQQHISVNVFGPAKTVQVLLPHLQERSVIANMVSSQLSHPQTMLTPNDRHPASAVFTEESTPSGVRITASAKQP